MQRYLGFRALLLTVAMAGPASSAWAAPITFWASQGNLAASATFDVVGNDLSVTLTNTSGADVLVPVDVLTAVFFTINGAQPVLAPVSAILGLGSTVLFGGTDPGGVVGGEWAYGEGLGGAPSGATRGISSSGYNQFGAANFPGSNLQGPAGLDGLQYGITSAGDDPSTGNTPVTGTNALIKNQVVFLVSGLPGGFDPSSRITNVSFQYGTALNEPNIYGTPLSDPNIPEPATCGWLLAVTLMASRRGKFLYLHAR